MNREKIEIRENNEIFKEIENYSFKDWQLDNLLNYCDLSDFEKIDYALINKMNEYGLDLRQSKPFSKDEIEKIVNILKEKGGEL